MTRRFRWWAAAILLLAAGLRFYDLDRKPLHHDEGVNGFFLTRLTREGVYRYDPANYHGPTLYYAAAVAVEIFGLETDAIRGTVALAGLLTVLLVLALVPSLGRNGALAGAALLAVSPGAVYFSRYFIHESLVVLFTLAVVVLGLRYRAGGGTRWLVAAFAAAALLVATKETAIVHLTVLGLAWLAAGWTLRWTGRDPGPGFPRPSRESLALAVGVFLAIHVLLFSSFFTHLQGVVDSVRALWFSEKTGTSAHLYPWYRHGQWLWRAEPVLVVLGGLGLVLALIRRDRREPVFFGFWAMGMLSAYSLVPYKTPWLDLNVVLPLALLAGYLVEDVARSSRSVAVALALAAAAWSAASAASLSFVHYDDERLPYVYAHTRRRFLGLVAEIRQIARYSGRGLDLPIAVTSPEHWPLPWYLRNFRAVGYWGKIPKPLEADVVVGETTQEAALRKVLGPSWEFLGTYPLRPGADLVLFARRSVSGTSP